MDWTTTDLDELAVDLWRWLEEGCRDECNPLRTPCLGTFSASDISLRTVVLRQVHARRRHLIGQADARSRKVRELRQAPQVGWLFYHPGERVQLRATGTAVVHQGDAQARAAWKRTPEVNRLNYGTAQPPGSPLMLPAPRLAAREREVTPVGESGGTAWSNFAVIRSTIDRLDWLYLGSAGHRRAGFEWVAGRWRGHWLVP